MNQHKSDQPAVRDSPKSRKEAARAALKQRRRQQLEVARSAIARLQQVLSAAKSLSAQREALSSHVDGFYEEIDKLTKGKAMLEVTPLMVEQANNIIRDAKKIIGTDTYLDRIKEFVPAGNNPVYPDVLVAIRGVRQSLARAKETLTKRHNQLSDRLMKARTVAAAIGLCLELDEDDTVPSKDELTERLNSTKVDYSLLYRAEDGIQYFNLDKLDRLDLERYFSEDVEEDEILQNGSTLDEDEEEQVGEDDLA